MYMSSPVLVNGRVVGLSHRKRGQYFGLDPATGKVEWTSEPGQGENAAFVLADGALLVLQGDGTLLVLRPDGASFSRSTAIASPRAPRSRIPSPRDGHPDQGREGLSLYAGRNDREHGRHPAAQLPENQP